MANRIISPQFSFVQYSNNHLEDDDWRDCGEGELPFCLPVHLDSDIRYQYIIESDTEAEADAVYALNQDLFVGAVYLGAPITSVADAAEFAAIMIAQTTADNLNIEKHRIDDTHILYVIDGLRAGTIETSDFRDGNCFQIAIKINTTPNLFGVSNCFQYVEDDCYTSVVEYSGDEDEADFYYCPGEDIYNRIRLPIHLKRPTYTEDSAQYTQSNGAIRVTKARVGKLYEAHSDYFPEWIHDNMRAMMIHDNKSIEGAKYSGDFVLSGDYTPEWQEGALNYPQAPVKFKVQISPFLIKNNNCGECSFYFDVDDYVFPDPMADGAPYTGFDLSDLVQTECTPVVYALVSFNPLAVSGASVVANLLGFTTLNPFPSGIGNTVIVTYSATCGGVTKQGIIYGHE